MQERKAEISAYLQEVVSPLVTPLMEELVKNRPEDILLFAQSYIQRLIQQRDTKKQPQFEREEQRSNPKHTSSESENESVDQEEVNKQIMMKVLNRQNLKKVSRLAISAQAYGKYNKQQQFIPKVIKKSKEIKSTIQKHLKSSTLFQNMSDEDINIVIDAMTITNSRIGQVVIKQGDQGNSLYVVGSGEYSCSKVINGVDTFLKNYKIGEYFGELALLYTAPRAATIKCTKTGVLYELDRTTFKYLVQGSFVKRTQKFRKILQKVSILDHIGHFQKQQLCDVLQQEVYEAGQIVFNQGDSGDKFYMVDEGEVVAIKDGQIVCEIKSGGYFGELALRNNAPRQTTIRCETQSKLVYVSRDAFKRLFGSIEEIFKKTEQAYKKIKK